VGNPGEKYKNTPHNIGFQVVDEFAARRSLSLKSKRFSGYYASEKVSGGEGDVVHVLKPLTYMNASGEAVKECLHYFSLSAESLIVVHDDADLEFGRIDIKRGGGSGGHRGVESIVEELEAKEFTRIRMGVGRSVGKTLSNHVLSSYTVEQKNILPEFLATAALAIEVLLREGLCATMNRFNGNRKKSGE
jgi:PTH1 family peptidyl-tRNA hydrolase